MSESNHVQRKIIQGRGIRSKWIKVLNKMFKIGLIEMVMFEEVMRTIGIRISKRKMNQVEETDSKCCEDSWNIQNNKKASMTGTK